MLGTDFVTEPSLGRKQPRTVLHMNPSSKDDSKSNQETQAFDPPLIHEEEVVHPLIDDNEKECPEEGEDGQVEEDKKRAEMATKEGIQRVIGGQL
jgi:hypothetical protein